MPNICKSLIPNLDPGGVYAPRGDAVRREIRNLASEAGVFSHEARGHLLGSAAGS
jgi:hypothetical protein